MEEKKTNIYEGNKRAFIATVLLVVILFSASYGFFSNFNTANAIYNTTIGNMANVTMIFPSNVDMSVTVNPVVVDDSCNNGDTVDDRAITESEHISDQYIKISNNSGVDITCDLEIWYEPIVPYYRSAANVNNLEEIAISEEIIGMFFDITDVTKPTKFTTYSYDIVNGGSVSDQLYFAAYHSSYCSSHPNAFDQSEQMGRTFRGVLKFKSAGCKKSGGG